MKGPTTVRDEAPAGQAGGRSPPRRLLGERMVLTGLLVGALGLGIGRIRYDWVERAGMAPEAFWAAKADWRARADIVLVGDSRMLCAGSPAAMQPLLPGRKILNYAFLGAGFDEKYLRAAEGVLKPTGGEKVIVLGLTPRGLTEGACRRSGFLDGIGASRRQRALARGLGEVMYFLRPMNHYEALATFGLAKRRDSRCFQDFRPDGWEATFIDPPHREAIREYATKFTDQECGPVWREAIDQLLQAVSRWRSEGITVFGFRPPSCLEMDELEDRLSGFDEAALVRAFTAAGGIWLTFDRAAYSTYDGSHLDMKSAARFSRDLAREMASRLEAADGVAGN